MSSDKRTKLLGASILEHDGLSGVESRTSEQVTNLGSIHQTVSTIPEVKQVEHLLHVCQTSCHCQTAVVNDERSNLF